jgi:hypothetical protein
MQLNLPILEQLVNCKNILIAGAGGGFDVFVGLPLYFTLKALGKTVHLANYSFCDPIVSDSVGESEVLIKDLLVGIKGKVSRILPYFPEGYLAQWFDEIRSEVVPIWMLIKPGAAPLLQAYRCLIEHLDIDALILVDGGVDSLMRGDEDEPGTMLEDSITLSAVEQLNVPVNILACLGFGTEIGDGIAHYHVLQNIAALAKAGGFLGSCALTAQMEAFQLYEAASRYVWEQPVHQKSHIGTQVISAVHGETGNFHPYEDDFSQRVRVYVSPLMSLYWFFDAPIVARHNLLAEALRPTQTTRDAMQIVALLRRDFKRRKNQALPY